MSDTFTVGKKLVELCKQNKNVEAVETLYSPHVVSVEAADPKPTEGFEAVLEKNKSWIAAHEVHHAETEGPWPHGDRFIVRFKYDVTAKEGPMAGHRMQLDETALYTVKDGKVTREEFFYHMGA